MKDAAARYELLLEGNRRFGSSAEDACLHIFGVLPEAIHERVIIAPWWKPDVFPDFASLDKIPLFPNASVLVWDLAIDGLPITYIRPGIGAPKMLDAVLSLGLTRCKQAIFIGAVGALAEYIAVGDVAVPEYAICGIGTNRYLRGRPLAQGDCFGEKTYPGEKLNQRLMDAARRHCADMEIGFHIAHTFCIDTIFAQFAYIDEIVGMGCDTIEMETAAAFEAAQLAGIELAALFSVSDNTIAKKSLYSGRTEEEIEHKKRTRRELFPKIIMDAFF